MTFKLDEEKYAAEVKAHEDRLAAMLKSALLMWWVGAIGGVALAAVLWYLAVK